MILWGKENISPLFLLSFLPPCCCCDQAPKPASPPQRWDFSQTGVLQTWGWLYFWQVRTRWSAQTRLLGDLGDPTDATSVNTVPGQKKAPPSPCDPAPLPVSWRGQGLSPPGRVHLSQPAGTHPDLVLSGCRWTGICRGSSYRPKRTRSLSSSSTASPSM